MRIDVNFNDDRAFEQAVAVIGASACRNGQGYMGMYGSYAYFFKHLDGTVTLIDNTKEAEAYVIFEYMLPAGVKTAREVDDTYGFLMFTEYAA